MNKLGKNIYIDVDDKLNYNIRDNAWKENIMHDCNRAHNHSVTRIRHTIDNNLWHKIFKVILK